VKFAGLDIAEMAHVPLKAAGQALPSFREGRAPRLRELKRDHPEKAEVMRRIAEETCARLEVLLDLGLGYLTLDRSTPTLSPGELQRLRLATQVHSNLFGVVYVLDEPSPACIPRTPKRCSARSTA
jgi:excinuclease ABC subunit A